MYEVSSIVRELTETYGDEALMNFDPINIVELVAYQAAPPDPDDLNEFAYLEEVADTLLAAPKISWEGIGEDSKGRFVKWFIHQEFDAKPGDTFRLVRTENDV